MSGASGRPSVLTPEVQRKVLAALRCGLSRAAAAARAGVGARTLRDWMARTDATEPYASFRAEVEAAEGACEARLAAVVFKAALEDPNQARWLLERRFPASWGRRQPEEHRPPAAGGLSRFMRPKGDAETGWWEEDPLANIPPWKRKPAGSEATTQAPTGVAAFLRPKPPGSPDPGS